MRHRLLIITTIPETLEFFRDHIAYVKGKGMDVHVLASPGLFLHAFAARERVTAHGVRMHRSVTPIADLVSLVELIRRLRAIRPTVVHATTPKAAFLGMLAAWMARVPVRIYHNMGVRFLTASGLKRLLLRLTERVTVWLAHEVLCVSHSLREFIIGEGLCVPEKISVLGNGSINGVDAGRFRPPPPEEAARLRDTLGIPADAFVVGFVGRLVRDKGLVELTRAWQDVRAACPAAHLLIAGPFETHDPLPAGIELALRADPRTHLLGEFIAEIERVYAVLDLLVLPTYREGFPVVMLEAAAMGLPTVATRVPGCVDAIQDRLTGTLVPPKDAGALAKAVLRYATDPDRRRRHGRTGRTWVLQDFRPPDLWEALWRRYDAALATRRPARSYAGKRIFDLLLMACLAPLILPVALIVALLVRLTFGTPILFRQQRPGLHGHPFMILKFRTMTNARDAEGRPLPDEERLTAFGRLLRSTSLDELPECVNVLKGDMSVVGPRPLLMKYLDRYSPAQRRRHDVLPGITGLAQIKGRNAITWPEKFALDLWYVEHQSLWLDLKIIVLTAWKVLLRQGITQPGQTTMEEFKGTR